ncbi:hypothetical protein JRQ81_015794 [Phrynocephalus forsythii]|uniref:Uncharacterized protein n=1 Tax=Phrynocephalus forsythii TaxID=171643 RepID=A0A9Q0XV89_9SAUR|nr:hypothetical protein JRQ81_015794 [Phrynocephalus forsythii]
MLNPSCPLEDVSLWDYTGQKAAVARECPLVVRLTAPSFFLPPRDVVASMAPSPRRRSRKEANALPSASSTFWAVMILVGLLIAYCSE